MDALGHRVERLRTDSAAEFVRDKEFRQWLVSNRVTQEASAPYAKHQNGVAEHHIQTIEDRMTALLIQAGLGTKYWGKAIQCAVATWNATSGNGKSLLEVLTGWAGHLEMLKPFGCRVYIRTNGSLQSHMELRAEPGIFLGYSGKTKGYKVSRDLQWKSCLIRAPRDCIFKEDEFPATTKWNDDWSQLERSATNRDGGIRPDPAPIIVDLEYRSRNCHDQPGSSQGKLVWNEIPRPNTPPLVLDDQYYSSNFEQSVTTQLRYGLRSG